MLSFATFFPGQHSSVCCYVSSVAVCGWDRSLSLIVTGWILTRLVSRLYCPWFLCSSRTSILSFIAVGWTFTNLASVFIVISLILKFACLYLPVVSCGKKMFCIFSLHRWDVGSSRQCRLLAQVRRGEHSKTTQLANDFILLLVVCVKCVHVFTCNWWAAGIAPVCLFLPLVGCDKTPVCLLLALGRMWQNSCMSFTCPW